MCFSKMLAICFKCYNITFVVQAFDSATRPGVQFDNSDDSDKCSND